MVSCPFQVNGIWLHVRYLYPYLPTIFLIAAISTSAAVAISGLRSPISRMTRAMQPVQPVW